MQPQLEQGKYYWARRVCNGELLIILVGTNAISQPCAYEAGCDQDFDLDWYDNYVGPIVHPGFERSK